jgi:hypothetical protein
MDGESHDGVVAFQPLTLGREAVMLGRVQVGEIMPIDGNRHGAAFRLALPESAPAWRPAADMDAARRGAIATISDWLEAAELKPMGAA